MKFVWFLSLLMINPLVAMVGPRSAPGVKQLSKIPVYRPSACKPNSSTPVLVRSQEVPKVSWATKIAQWFGFKKAPTITEASHAQVFFKQSQSEVEKITKILKDFDHDAQTSLPQALRHLEKIHQEWLNKPIPKILPQKVVEETGDTVLKRLIQMTGSSSVAQKEYLADLSDKLREAKTPQQKEKLLHEFRKKKSFSVGEQFEIIDFILRQGANPNYDGFKGVPGHEFVNALPLMTAFDSGNLGAAQALIKAGAEISDSLIRRLENELRSMKKEKSFVHDPKRQELFEQEYELRKTIFKLIKENKKTPFSGFKQYMSQLFKKNR